MKTIARCLLGLSAVASAASTTWASAEVARIALIDPLSGPFAALGENQFKTWQYIADLANKEKWAGNNTLEIVAFDNKASVQETLNQFTNVAGRGFRFVAQANGSGAGLALLEAVNKYNERNPGQEVVYLNHGAVDPEFTNGRCSFWQFSFDSNSDMKMQALVNYIVPRKNVKKIYILGQNYAFGRSVSKSAKAMLAAKRPDIQIVGDELHPIGEVKDFAPYVAKIKASGADAVITGNWGADLTLLVKAAKEAGVTADFYTYYAVLKGAPSAMGDGGVDKVRYVGVWNVNNETFAGKDIVEGFKKKYADDFTWIQAYSAVSMLSKAIKTSNSTNPTKVAFAMENMSAQSLNGEVQMRGTDHQLQQPLYVAVWSKVNGKDVRYDQENTGLGWKTERKISAYEAALPTSCHMTRPAAP